MVNTGATSGVSIYTSEDKRVPSLSDLKKVVVSSDNAAANTAGHNSKGFKFIKTANSKQAQNSLVAPATPVITVAKSVAVTHIRKTLGEVIEIHFPGWQVNNISSNKNILKTVVTIVSGDDAIIDKKDILKKLFVSINKRLKHKLSFKARSSDTEIFITDVETIKGMSL